MLVEAASCLHQGTAPPMNMLVSGVQFYVVQQLAAAAFAPADNSICVALESGPHTDLSTAEEQAGKQCAVWCHSPEGCFAKCAAPAGGMLEFTGSLQALNTLLHPITTTNSGALGTQNVQMTWLACLSCQSICCSSLVGSPACLTCRMT